LTDPRELLNPFSVGIADKLNSGYQMEILANSADFLLPLISRKIIRKSGIVSNRQQENCRKFCQRVQNIQYVNHIQLTYVSQVLVCIKRHCCGSGSEATEIYIVFNLFMLNNDQISFFKNVYVNYHFINKV
jgi:hypothetical protein